MNLITVMLQPHPYQRFTIADIIGHPWMKGDHATHAEVKEEFVNRHKIVNAKRKSKAEENDLKK